MRTKEESLYKRPKELNREGFEVLRWKELVSSSSTRREMTKLGSGGSLWERLAVYDAPIPTPFSSHNTGGPLTTPAWQVETAKTEQSAATSSKMHKGHSRLTSIKGLLLPRSHCHGPRTWGAGRNHTRHTQMHMWVVGWAFFFFFLHLKIKIVLM